MARLGKRNTECIVKDPTVHALYPYYVGYGKIEYGENVVVSICKKFVAEEYVHFARVDWSGKRPKHLCSTCWLRERGRQLQVLNDERDWLDRMGIIQTVEDSDDDNDGGNVPVGA